MFNSKKRLVLGWTTWILCAMMYGKAQGAPLPTCLVSVPEADSRQAACIPLLFDFNAKKFIARNKVEFRVAHEAGSLVFDAIIPLKSNYHPGGLSQRDAALWNDDRIEVFLQPHGEGPFYQFILNAAGAIYDGKSRDCSWNSTAEYKATVNKDHWQAHLCVPYDQIGFDPARGNLIKGNVAAGSNEPGNSFLLSWAPMTINFLRVGDFGTLRLTDGKEPVVAGLKIGEVQPAANDVAYLPVTFVVGDKSLRRNVPLEEKKPLATAHLRYQDTFAYDVKVCNRFWPDIELVALDTNRFYIHLRNAKTLLPFAQRLELHVDGEKAAEAPIHELKRTIIDTADWKEGPHRFEYRLINSKTNETFSVTADEVHTVKFKESQFDITGLDASRYFRPIAYDAEKGMLEAALSEFDLSKGILPRQIKVNGMAILQNALAIVFEGKELETDGPVELVQANKNRVILKSKTRNGDKRLFITATYDFDGFVWFDVSLESDHPFEYGPLEVILSTQLDSDVLLSYDSLYPDKLFSKTNVRYTLAPTDPVPADFNDISTKTNSELLDAKTTRDVALSGFVSLATDTNVKYRGVGLCSEGPRGWNLSNYDQSYTVCRDGPLASLTMNVSDGKTRFRVDQIAFSFGLQPFPLRNIANDFHGNVRLEPSHGFNATKLSYPGGTFIEYAAQKGLKNHILFEYWTSVQNYWVALENEEIVTDYLAKMKAAGVGVFFYFGFLLSNEAPGFKLYHDILLRKPTNYPAPGFRPYIYYGMGDPDQDSWTVCYASPWGDRFAQGIGEAIRKYGLKGIYLDGTFVAPGCANTKHGCGVVDMYGRKVVTIPVRKYRRLSQMAYHAGIQTRPDFEMDLHIAVPTPPYLGLLSSYFTREDSNLFDGTPLTSPKNLRGIFNGRLYGVPCDGLRRSECGINEFAAQVLLLDTFPRSGLGYNAPFLCRTPELWQLYEKYNLTADTFTPFFVSNKKITSSNPDVFVSYYDAKDAVVIVASNYWSDKPGDCVIDVHKLLGEKDFSGVDVWSKETLQFKGGSIRTEIPKRSMRLIVIEKDHAQSIRSELLE